MSDQPVISFSIVSWNVREYLWACLTSIQRNVRTPHEILVVDNASSDGTVDMLRASFPNVRLIANTRNDGFARANNQAIRQARGRYIVLLNPDTVVDEDIFPPLMTYLDQHPLCAAIGPELRHRDSTHQQSVRHFPTARDQVIVLLKLRHLLAGSRVMRHYVADPGAHQEQPSAVDQIMGACMVVPRHMFERVGLFDDGYPNWFEEVDWCQRAHRAGCSIVYYPQVHLTHLGGMSFGQALSWTKQRWFNAGLRRYASKFWSWPERLAILVTLPVNYLLSALQTLIIRY